MFRGPSVVKCRPVRPTCPSLDTCPSLHSLRHGAGFLLRRSRARPGVTAAASAFPSTGSHRGTRGAVVQIGRDLPVPIMRSCRIPGTPVLAPTGPAAPVPVARARLAAGEPAIRDNRYAAPRRIVASCSSGRRNEWKPMSATGRTRGRFAIRPITFRSPDGQEVRSGIRRLPASRRRSGRDEHAPGHSDASPIATEPFLSIMIKWSWMEDKPPESAVPSGCGGPGWKNVASLVGGSDASAPPRRREGRDNPSQHPARCR